MMKVTLTDYTQDPEFKIGLAAAECYDAKTDRESCTRRAAQCKDKGHLATLRFAYASFHIEGISRICSHQLVRVAHAGILQRCVTGDTKIAVSNGVGSNLVKWVPIKKLWDLQNGATGYHNWKRVVRVYDEDTRLFSEAKIKEVFYNGVKPVFQVSTEGGLSIKCTAHHKFYTQRGFVELKDLNVGDWVARNGVPAHTDAVWLAEEKRKSIANKTGLQGIANAAGVTTHTIRKWLKIHRLQFTKKEVASYTEAWNKDKNGAEIPWFGRKASVGEREAISRSKRGESNPGWAGGTTKPRSRIANQTSSNRLVRERVMSADGHRCRLCGSTVALEIDHIVPVREAPDLAHDLSNLQTLCHECHILKSVEESNRMRKTVRFVQVLSITPAGSEDVFDLEVDHKSHNYVANKLLVHNSQRYVKESGIKFIRPPAFHLLPKDLQHAWDNLERQSRNLYNTLVDGKHMRKEDARFTLLHSAETSLQVCMNFQAWQDFLRNRTEIHAQWEVREVALEIERQLKEIAPNLF